MSEERCQSHDPTTNDSIEQQYFKLLSNKLSKYDGEPGLRRTNVGRCSNHETIAHLYRSDGYSRLRLSELLLALDNRPKERTVVVIENIDIEGVSVLGGAWGVDPDFFITHSQNPAGQSLWRSIFKPSSVENRNTRQRVHRVIDPSAASTGQAGVQVDGSKRRWHVDGLFQLAAHSGASVRRNDIQIRNKFPRRLDFDSVYGYQSNTRVSCLSIKGCCGCSNLYLTRTSKIDK